jgi:hypothetical protein
MRASPARQTQVWSYGAQGPQVAPACMPVCTCQQSGHQQQVTRGARGQRLDVHAVSSQICRGPRIRGAGGQQEVHAVSTMIRMRPAARGARGQQLDVHASSSEIRMGPTITGAGEQQQELHAVSSRYTWGQQLEAQGVSGKRGDPHTIRPENTPLLLFNHSSERPCQYHCTSILDRRYSITI